VCPDDSLVRVDCALGSWRSVLTTTRELATEQFHLALLVIREQSSLHGVAGSDSSGHVVNLYSMLRGRSNRGLIGLAQRPQAGMS
jgi:hypothetical protein